jgi:adenine/guanine/hypoxanthine permease
VPVAAAVVLIQLSGALGGVGKSAADLTGDAALTHRALLVLGNGFILTSVLWGAALAWIIDRRLLLAAAALALASLATLFGVIHSPLPNGALFWPWDAGVVREVAWPVAGAYGLLAALCATLARQRAV